MKSYIAKADIKAYNISSSKINVPFIQLKKGQEVSGELMSINIDPSNDDYDEFILIRNKFIVPPSAVKIKTNTSSPFESDQKGKITKVVKNVANGGLKEMIRKDYYKSGAIIGGMTGAFFSLWCKKNLLLYSIIGLIGGGYVGHIIKKELSERESDRIKVK